MTGQETKVKSPCIEVRFDSGQDVLSAYWGYLTHGGLVIPNQDEIAVGATIQLSVLLASAGSRYDLRGRVTQRHPDGARMIVAFDPSQPQDMLISEALAETENTPPRHHRRYSVALDATIGEHAVRIVNVSVGGLCIECEGRPIGSVGDGFTVRVQGRELSGVVKWVAGREFGLQFETQNPEALQLVELHLERLR